MAAGNGHDLGSGGQRQAAASNSGWRRRTKATVAVAERGGRLRLVTGRGGKGETGGC